MKNNKNVFGKVGAGLIALALKIGPKLLTVLAKFAKIGKFGFAAVSMVTYSYIFTWKFAVMIMVLLFVHEYGHIWAMKRCGLKTKGIYFIPFLGAAAVSEEMFKSRRDEAYIAIMGPIFGLVLSGIALGIYIETQNTLFAAAAGWMAMVNLFNLLPINPLDGGRIMKSIAFSVNSKLGHTFLAIGLILSAILIFWAGIVLFLFLLVVGIIEFIIEYKIRNENNIIKRCIKHIDNMFTADFTADYPGEVQHAINSIKSILSDDNVEPSVRIDTVISIGKMFDRSTCKVVDNDRGIDYDTVMLAHIISPILEGYDNMPRMATRGIIITAVIYICTITALWALMWYTGHIPEVEIARKFFMS